MPRTTPGCRRARRRPARRPSRGRRGRPGCARRAGRAGRRSGGSARRTGSCPVRSRQLVRGAHADQVRCQAPAAMGDPAEDVAPQVRRRRVAVQEDDGVAGSHLAVRHSQPEDPCVPDRRHHRSASAPDRASSTADRSPFTAPRPAIANPYPGSGPARHLRRPHPEPLGGAPRAGGHVGGDVADQRGELGAVPGAGGDQRDAVDAVDEEVLVRGAGEQAGRLGVRLGDAGRAGTAGRSRRSARGSPGRRRRPGRPPTRSSARRGTRRSSARGTRRRGRPAVRRSGWRGPCG